MTSPDRSDPVDSPAWILTFTVLPMVTLLVALWASTGSWFPGSREYEEPGGRREEERREEARRREERRREKRRAEELRSERRRTGERRPDERRPEERQADERRAEELRSRERGPERRRPERSGPDRPESYGHESSGAGSHGPESYAAETHGPETHGPESHGSEYGSEASRRGPEERRVPRPRARPGRSPRLQDDVLWAVSTGRSLLGSAIDAASALLPFRTAPGPRPEDGGTGRPPGAPPAAPSASSAREPDPEAAEQTRPPELPHGWHVRGEEPAPHRRSLPEPIPEPRALPQAARPPARPEPPARPQPQASPGPEPEAAGPDARTAPDAGPAAELAATAARESDTMPLGTGYRAVVTAVTWLRPEGYVEWDGGLYRARWRGPADSYPRPGEPVKVTVTPDTDPPLLIAGPLH
ncbi:hypothetical protein [Streptomyces sp. NPDC127114]|uniref:hypothetical protein n=1 Tax=Streptomyces sp. NPDC127114 TaxID=3345366 RepID=UPI00363BD91F